MSGEFALKCLQQELVGVTYLSGDALAVHQEWLKQGPEDHKQEQEKTEETFIRWCLCSAWAECTMGKEKEKRPGQVPPDLVDCPTQLICNWIFICPVTKLKEHSREICFA